MKILFFLLFSSLSIFSNTLYKLKEKTTNYHNSGFAIVLHEKTNNSTHYNLKKNEENYKKSSFQEKIINSTNKVFISEIKKNASSSLQILAIKLDSVQQLHQKGLLRKEVLTNTDYYQTFLIELKKSTIISNEYVFLENALLKASFIDTNQKYQSSFNINLFLGLLLAFVLSFLLIFNKRKTVTIDLTKQEIIIKKLIIDGKTNKEIASDLHISLSTVKTHISNIYQKLNITNRKELLLKFKN